MIFNNVKLSSTFIINGVLIVGCLYNVSIGRIIAILSH